MTAISTLLVIQPVKFEDDILVGCEVIESFTGFSGSAMNGQVVLDGTDEYVGICVLTNRDIARLVSGRDETMSVKWNFI